jgi:anaerobic selenocysteine-containing dehydrogenase
VRGHSNVQGDRTMGIEEKPTTAFLDRLEQVFGFEPPRIMAMTWWRPFSHAGRPVKVFIGLGGNFAMATPDTPLTFEALRRAS